MLSSSSDRSVRSTSTWISCSSASRFLRPVSVSVRAASARLRTRPVTASRTARSSAAAGKITPTSVSQLPATTSCGDETSSTTR